MDCRGSLDWHFPALGLSNPQFNSETNVGRQISLTLLWFASSPTSIPNISQLCLCCKKISRKWVSRRSHEQIHIGNPKEVTWQHVEHIAHQPFTARIHTVHTQCAGHDRWTRLLCANVSQHDLVATTLLITEKSIKSPLFFERSAIQVSEHCGNATSMYSIHVCVSLISVPLTLFWWVFAFASSEKSTYINIFCKTLAHNTCTLPLWKFVFYSFHKFKQTSSFTPASFHLDVGAISEFLPQIKVFKQKVVSTEPNKCYIVFPYSWPQTEQREKKIHVTSSYRHTLSSADSPFENLHKCFTVLQAQRLACPCSHRTYMPLKPCIHSLSCLALHQKTFLLKSRKAS